MKTVETDYLVIGAGAMGLAFADEIIHGSKSLRVVLVDRRANAGGHWNDAYPFVRLHQSAVTYGVNSEHLGSGDPHDLASKSEILGYNEAVIKKLTATGRFTFLPLCEYQDGRVISRVVPGLEYKISVQCKTVDAAYMEVTVPSTTPPKYDVEKHVPLVPINGLAEAAEPWRNYCVIGSGKTGMDAVLYLLERGVNADAIRWIMPNDAWMQTRECTMPDGFIDFSTSQVRSLSRAGSIDEIFALQEADGIMMRLNLGIQPTRFRCATVSRDELVRLRSVGDVVRSGRVKKITADAIHLESGVVESKPGTLYVDCSACGLSQRPSKPIFEEEKVTLQPVFMCQQVQSAAMIAALELRVDDNVRKNDLVTPIPHPEVPSDIVRGLWFSMKNVDAMVRVMPWWMLSTRLLITRHATLMTNLQLLWNTSKYYPREQHVRSLMVAASVDDSAAYGVSQIGDDQPRS